MGKHEPAMQEFLCAAYALDKLIQKHEGKLE